MILSEQLSKNNLCNRSCSNKDASRWRTCWEHICMLFYIILCISTLYVVMPVDSWYSNFEHISLSCYRNRYMCTFPSSTQEQEAKLSNKTQNKKILLLLHRYNLHPFICCVIILFI